VSRANFSLFAIFLKRIEISSKMWYNLFSKASKGEFPYNDRQQGNAGLSPHWQAFVQARRSHGGGTADQYAV
jgi:hypothetical protein